MALKQWDTDRRKQTEGYRQEQEQEQEDSDRGHMMKQIGRKLQGDTDKETQTGGHRP